MQVLSYYSSWTSLGCIFWLQAEVRRREEEQRLKDEEEAKRRLLEEQQQREEAEAEKEVCSFISL